MNDVIIYGWMNRHLKIFICKMAKNIFLQIRIYLEKDTIFFSNYFVYPFKSFETVLWGR